MSFTNGKFMVKVNGFKLSLSHTSPPLQEENFLPTYNTGIKSKVKSASIRISNPTNHFSLSGNSTITLSEFNAFVRQNRMEKLSQVIRQDKKYEHAETIEVHQAILQDYEEQFGNLLQKHSMMPNEDSTPDNPELKVDLDHLDSETAQAFSTMKARYPNLYSTHKHHVGLFSGWAAKAIINTAINCRQKQRGRFLLQTAKQDLDRYFKAGVLSYCRAEPILMCATSR